MKLPKDIPFVILDQNMYGTRESSRLTEDFIEWLVRDCARAARDDMRRGGESSVVASLSTAVERAILARYGLEPKP